MSPSGIDAYLPNFLVNTWFLWFPLGHWLAFLLIIPITFFLSTLLTRLMTALFLHYFRRRFKEQGDQRFERLTGPIRILLFAAAIYVISLISQSILTSAFLAYVSLTLAVLGATWLCLRFIDIFFELREKRMVASVIGEDFPCATGEEAGQDPGGDDRGALNFLYGRASI